MAIEKTLSIIKPDAVSKKILLEKLLLDLKIMVFA
jgi:nucleoside diphosphate kinase